MAAGADQALNSPTALLAGAGSQIGVFATPRLLDAGFKVLAISRSGAPVGLPALEGVQWVTEGEAVCHAGDCRHLLSAGPLDLALRLVDSTPGLRRAVVFSSTSVLSKQHSGNREERGLAARMLELEARLLSAAVARGFGMSILRPTLVYGCGLDANISRLAGWVRRFGFVPVSSRASGLRQPVHADDLAAAAVRVLTSDREFPGLITVAGGETLAYTEMVRRIFRALGKPERLLHLPECLFAALAGAVGLVRPGGSINAEMVRRQALDLVFDDSEARELLDYDPRAFRPAAEDFTLPAFGERPTR
ncbi:MAG: nucleoside-diphosphate sugar epimerase [Lysobacterales bacterium]|jgi:nucleoside-diphosphate-sugar epimerase